MACAASARLANVDWAEVDRRLPMGHDDTSKAQRKRLFDRLDPNGSGTISMSEAKDGLPKLLIEKTTSSTGRLEQNYLVPVKDVSNIVQLAFRAASAISEDDGDDDENLKANKLRAKKVTEAKAQAQAEPKAEPKAKGRRRSASEAQEPEGPEVPPEVAEKLAAIRALGIAPIEAVKKGLIEASVALFYVPGLEREYPLLQFGTMRFMEKKDRVCYWNETKKKVMTWSREQLQWQSVFAMEKAEFEVLPEATDEQVKWIRVVFLERIKAQEEVKKYEEEDRQRAQAQAKDEPKPKRKPVSKQKSEKTPALPKDDAISRLYIDRQEFHALLTAFRMYLELQVMFDAMDDSGDRVVSLEESLKALPALKAWGWTAERLEIKYSLGRAIKYEDFAQMCIQRRVRSLGLNLDAIEGIEGIVDAASTPATADDEKAKRVQKIRELFSQWDKDGSGSISCEEMTFLLQKLSPGIRRKEMKDMFDAADSNKDGKVDYNEFLSWIFQNR